MNTPITMTTRIEGQIDSVEIIRKAQPRDELRFRRKDNGKILTARCVRRDEEKLYFVTDIVDRKPMRTRNERCTWRDCHVRAVIGQLAEKALPDEILDIVVPRVIEQRFDKEVIITEDKFWIPSATEIGASEDCDPDDEKAFEAISDERDRIAIDEDGETWWYWLRSANSAYSFRCVYGSGSLYYSSANSTYGVVLGFCIDL